MDKNKKWMSLPRWHDEYIKGVDKFIEKAFSFEMEGEDICCPCMKCVFRYLLSQDVVKDHLICNDFVDGHDEWVFHAEKNGVGLQRTVSVGDRQHGLQTPAISLHPQKGNNSSGSFRNVPRAIPNASADRNPRANASQWQAVFTRDEDNPQEPRVRRSKARK